MKHVRKPTVSGMFYSAGKNTLYNQINNCFYSDHGPGFIADQDNQKLAVKGVIVPHAGYPFSGGITSFAYNAILNSGFADVFIILGPNHHGVGSKVAMSSSGLWQTPIGEIPVDETIAKNLSTGIINIDDDTMSYQENSIEVQLPFLQFISKNQQFSILPIAMLMQDKETARKVGLQIADVIKEEKRSIMLIASTDFSHEGVAYGKIPPRGIRINKFVLQQDGIAIDYIKKLDPEGLIDVVYEKQISMCGFGAAAAVLTAAKKLGAVKVELLKYGTSYDVHPDNNACVGYASFAIY